MKAWKIIEAKDHFAEMLNYCYQEPQLVYEKNDPVAVMVNIKVFKELVGQHHRGGGPTIQQLLNEIQTIVHEDPFEINLPKRSDRFNSTERVLDELPV